jgi:hypothetical protein
MVEEWVRGDYLTLVANPNYWGEPPKTKSLIFRWNEDSAARLTSLASGEVEGIDNPDPNNLNAIQSDSTLKLYPREALNVMYLGLNNTKPPFDDERVRQAIAVGIDRQAIIDKYYPPGQVWLTTLHLVQFQVAVKAIRGTHSIRRRPERCSLKQASRMALRSLCHIVMSYAVIFHRRRRCPRHRGAVEAEPEHRCRTRCTGIWDIP